MAIDLSVVVALMKKRDNLRGLIPRVYDIAELFHLV